MTPDRPPTMDASPNRRSKGDVQPKGLGSAEYRARLLTKLNCLIAVLEVAIGKISRSMDLPGANEDRLSKIRLNLENTLSICHRARQTLEKGMARPALPAPSDTASGHSRAQAPRMTYRDYVELSSIDEYRKFKSMSPISAEELAEVDVDDIVDRLLDQ